MEELIKLVPDALIIAGAGALSYGSGLVYPAAGFIVAGVLMIAGGIQAARKVSK